MNCKLKILAKRVNLLNLKGIAFRRSEKSYFNFFIQIFIYFFFTSNFESIQYSAIKNRIFNIPLQFWAHIQYSFTIIRQYSIFIIPLQPPMLEMRYWSFTMTHRSSDIQHSGFNIQHSSLSFNIQVLNWTSRMNGWPFEANPLRALGERSHASTRSIDRSTAARLEWIQMLVRIRDEVCLIRRNRSDNKQS